MSCRTFVASLAALATHRDFLIEVGEGGGLFNKGHRDQGDHEPDAGRCCGPAQPTSPARAVPAAAHRKGAAG